MKDNNHILIWKNFWCCQKSFQILFLPVCLLSLSLSLLCADLGSRLTALVLSCGAFSCVVLYCLVLYCVAWSCVVVLLCCVMLCCCCAVLSWIFLCYLALSCAVFYILPLSLPLYFSLYLCLPSSCFFIKIALLPLFRFFLSSPLCLFSSITFPLSALS